MLALLPDSGRSYLSKFLDDKWMLEHGFLERGTATPTVAELLRAKEADAGRLPALVTIAAHQRVGEAIDLMQRYSISQLPVVRDGDLRSLADVIGSLQDRDLLDRVFRDGDALHESVAAAMQPPLAAVEASASVDAIVAALTGGTNAVLVDAGGARRGRDHPLRPARVPRPPALAASPASARPASVRPGGARLGRPAATLRRRPPGLRAAASGVRPAPAWRQRSAASEWCSSTRSRPSSAPTA